MKVLLVLLIIILLCSFAESTDVAKAPYEATWMKLSKVGDSYVAYNYPSLWGDGKTKSPEIFRAGGDSLTWITYSDDPVGLFYKFNNVVKLNDSLYRFDFRDGTTFLFNYVDKANHIARWRISYNCGAEYYGVNLYIDSLYNTFPIVDFEWPDDWDIAE